MTAVKHGETHKVRRYLSFFANPNYINEDGFTPLTIASKEGHTEVVKLLLSKGANLQETYKGHTPLQLATLYGHKDIAELLTRH